MKTNSLILLASLAVLAISASAAQSQPQTNVVVLPPYVVNAPRYLPAEQKVNASLNELRQQAHVPACIVTELPMLKDQAVLPGGLVKIMQDAKILHVAKL